MVNKGSYRPRKRISSHSWENECLFRSVSGGHWRIWVIIHAAFKYHDCLVSDAL